MENKKCWRKRGCPFNSNNSSRFMKCWQEEYSVEACAAANKAEWDKIDIAAEAIRTGKGNV